MLQCERWEQAAAAAPQVQVPYLGNSLLQEGEPFLLYKFCWGALAPRVLTPKRLRKDSYYKVFLI